MSSRSGTRDVLVIGGGPPGSTAATLFAKKGRSVTLLEKEKFPREHVGESLLPFCYPIFKKLGVRFIAIDGKRSTTW